MAFVNSIIITVLALYVIQIPTHWIYIALLAIGAVGIVINYAGRLFIFLNIAYALFIVFYAPLSSLSASLLPEVQPKFVAIMVAISALSILGRCMLFKAVDSSSSEDIVMRFFLVIAVVAAAIQMSRMMLYNSALFFIAMGCLSLAILRVTPAFALYKIKRKHLLAALGIFVLMPVINLLPLDKSVKSIGFINYHSVWARSDVPYTTDDWTLKSNYSYSEFTKTLSAKYKPVNIDSERDLREKLHACDAAIIMTPTVPFSAAEKGMMTVFMKSGGNLIVIADHTDLYGHGRVINALIEETGLAVNYDAFISSEKWQAEVFFRNAIFGAVRPLTASSVSARKAVNVMSWGHNWISEDADYNAPNFFGRLTWTGDDRVVDLPVAATVKVGEGRLTVFTDSTMFSNFALYQPRALHAMEYLISKGGFLSSAIYYYSLTVFVAFIMSVVVCNYREKLLMFIFLISVLASGTCLFYDINIDGYFDAKSRIDLVSDELAIRESPPNRGPASFALSNLYSNLARFNVQPNWIGSQPSDCSSSQQCLWLTTYENYRKWSGRMPKYVVIVDDNKEIESLGFEKKDIGAPPSQFEAFKGSNRQVWSTSESRHTIALGESSVFASYGVLDDSTVGTWWATIDPSPYRREMMARFARWLKEGRGIDAYEYPEIGLIKGNKSAKLLMQNRPEIKLHDVGFRVVGYGNAQYVYLGGEMWGVFKQENKHVYVLGGPETSDNYHRHGQGRFVIK